MIKKLSVRDIVQVSFFAALSIVLTRLFSIMLSPTLRLGFGEIPLIVSGVLLGPVLGGITGFVSDMVGFMINPQGKFHLGFVISSILWGMIPGILNYIFSTINNKEEYGYKRIFTIIVITRTIIGIGLNTHWLSQLYNLPYIVLLGERVLLNMIMIPIESYLLLMLINKLRIAIEFE